MQQLARQHFLLLAAVFVDLFSVALVVPLLPKVFKQLGGESEMWGFMVGFVLLIIRQFCA